MNHEFHNIENVFPEHTAKSQGDRYKKKYKCHRRLVQEIQYQSKKVIEMENNQLWAHGFELRIVYQVINQV